jgi:hypothetical protein
MPTVSTTGTTQTGSRLRPAHLAGRAAAHPAQTVLTEEASAFIRYVAEHSTHASVSEELPRIQVEKISSSIATLYESLRNTVDRTDQHLLRRSAIFRFLKRHVLVYGARQALGELLVRELIRSGYVPNNSFPEQDIARVDAVIQKYIAFNEEVRRLLPNEQPRQLPRWGLGLAAAEIEQLLVSSDREEALVRFAYAELRQRIRWDDQAIAPADRDLQLYIAVHRAVFNSDAVLVEYHLLKSYLPELQSLGADQAPRLAKFALQYRPLIQHHIYHPYGARLSHKVRRMVIPMRTLMDMVVAHPEDAENRVLDTKLFISDAVKVVEGFYQDNKIAQRRSTLRSILFIFITKMLVAVALEVPYDLWTNGAIRYLPVGVNVIFHPLFLFALGTFVRFPGKENTKRILSDLRATLVADRRAPTYYVRLYSRRSTSSNVVLGALYLLTFGVTFGGLVYLLGRLDFGLLGSSLFLFFLSLVTFVGLRLRARARTYFVVRRSTSLAGSLFWFLVSPIVEVGRWVSNKFARYNVFLFFFDIVLEAPIKAVTYGLEEWFRFARERSEDMIE